MKPQTGDTVRVVLPATVIEAKHGEILVRVQCPGGPQVMRFDANGHGADGAKLKKAKRAGVEVAQ